MGKREWLKPPGCKFDLGEQIKELKRELRMRRKVYPRQILENKLTSEEANERWRKLKDTIRSLEFIQKRTVENQAELPLGEQEKSYIADPANKIKWNLNEVSDPIL